MILPPQTNGKVAGGGGVQQPRLIIKAVLFDMDGTLLDTESLSDKSILATFGDKIPSHIHDKLNHLLPWEIKEPTLGKRGDEWVPMVIDYAVQKLGVTDPPRWQDFWEQQEEILASYCHQVQECTGASALVNRLAAADIPMCIATSSTMASVVKKRTNHQTLFAHMKFIVSGEMVQNPKPSPDIYIEAARRMGVPPSQCLVFEDAVAGCQAARAAGCGGVVAVPDRRCPNPMDAYGKLADQVLVDLNQFDLQTWNMWN